MPTYQTINPLARTSPLRSIPLLRPAWTLHRVPMPTFAPTPTPVFEQGRGEFFVPTAAALLTREMANAEAALREAVRVYDAARAGIGQANRTRTAAVVAGGRVVMPSLPFTVQRIHERKSAAFRLFNQRRSLLVGARHRVDAARAALGLPSLAAVQERHVVAVTVHVNKARPVRAGNGCAGGSMNTSATPSWRLLQGSSWLALVALRVALRTPTRN